MSGKNFDVQPWVIVNTKGDPLLNEIGEIEGVQHLDVSETPGDRGLYIVSPTPDQGIELDAFLGRVWAKQNVGVYIDEGYMIEVDDNLNSLLTQGRSRNCPVIMLTQRPSWITKFVFSESDYVQLFNLQIADDRKKIAGLVPVSKDYRLPPHYSYWYDVGDNKLTKLSPVPPPEAILLSFRAKFPPDEAHIETGEAIPAEPDQQSRAVRKNLVI